MRRRLVQCADRVSRTTLAALTVAVAAGAYDVTVSATNVSLGLGQTRALQGRVWFEQTGGDLATTGAYVWPLLGVSVALSVVGVLLVLLGRRRRREGDGEVEETW